MKKLFLSLLSLATVYAQPWRTGYYWQPGSSVLPVSEIPFSKYTHVIHYATLPTYDSGTDYCGVDVTSYSLSANAAQFISGAHASGTKALISMVNDSSGYAIRTCTNSAHLSQFVSAIANVVQTYGYDGFDIDWEGAIINSQYQQWIVALRAAMPNKILTVAGGWNQRYVLAQIQDDIDQINCGSYDADLSTVAGQWRGDTMYNSALYQGGNSDWITADAIYYYMVQDAGIASSKIGIGMPFYARIKQGCMAGFLNNGSCSQNVNSFGQQYASGNAITNPRNAINFNSLVNSTYWTSSTHVWDAAHGAEYLRYEPGGPNQNAFIPYSGVLQMNEAVKYILKVKLGGIMTYDLAGEYLGNQSGDARYPLSTAIYQSMVNAPPPPVPAPVPPPALPLTVQVTPDGGRGKSAQFTVNLNDTKGFGAIQQVNLLVNLSGVVNSCYIQYSPITKTLFLANDTDTNWSSAALGSSTTLQNSQCAVDVSSTTSSWSGSTLTVTIPVSFFSRFDGVKNIYTFAADSSYITGWQKQGIWIVQ